MMSAGDQRPHDRHSPRTRMPRSRPSPIGSKPSRANAARRRFSGCSAMPAPARPRWPGTSPRASTARCCSRPSPARPRSDAQQGLRARLDHSQPDLQGARQRRGGTPSFDLWDDAPASKAKLIVIDECSMVDAELGRDLMSFRRAGAGAGRSGATAADPGRRLLHRSRARRHADRGAPAGRGQSDRPAVDGRARRPRSRAGRLWRDASGRPRASSIRSA